MNDFWKDKLKHAATGTVAIALFCLAHYVFHLPDDNIIEQTVEQVIDKEYGINVDFSPKK